jgi:soluble lytic murein transglycosylase
MRVRHVSVAVGLGVALTGCVLRSPSLSPSNGGSPTAAAPRPARPALGEADQTDLGDLALLWQARDAQAAGDLAMVRSSAARMAERYADSVWAGDLYLLAGSAAMREGDQTEARRRLADALPHLDETTAAWRRAVIMLAEASAQAGDDVMALGLARSLREKHPRGIADRRARRLTDRILARRPALAGDPSQQLDEAALRLREGDVATALAFADRLTDRGGSLGGRALLVRAQAERALGRSTQAEATCKRVSETAAAPLAAEALATAARWRWNTDDDAGAERLFERARDRAPGTGTAAEATYALGRIAQESRRWDRAAAAYAEVASAGDATLARAGRWGGAWVWYLAGDWARAAAAFGPLAARGDGDALAARYWQARAFERMGDARGTTALAAIAEAKPDTYYGWMARRRLGSPPAPLAVIPPPGRPPFPEALQGPHARRARALLELGLPHLARREVDALRGTADPELLVRAYEAVGAPEGAIRLAAALPRTPTTRRYLYPLGYWSVVQPAADQAGLDPLLVQALIRQESAFAERAVSPADAYGLMQLLPRTAADVAATRGEAPPDLARLTQADVNVALGTTLLRRLLEQYGGSEVKALAAYNAGPDAVAKWEQRHGHRDEDEFVELISFRETKHYVKVVLENRQVYRTLYAPSAVASSRGNPPNAPFDMMTMTSPACADAAR